MKPTTRLPKIPSDQITPLVAELLGTIQLQMEEIQFLKDEIARLKGQKPKPKIKPSNLEKETDKKKSSKKKPKSRKKSKTKKLEINQDIPLKPENLPPGSKFKGYQDYVVQDLILASWNIRYRRERWQTPSGDYAIGQLPENIDGHFSSSLVSFVLYQHYGCCVTQPLILEQLHELGVDISSGQVNNIIINNKERFHNEKDLILSTELQISNYINVDDTCARGSITYFSRIVYNKMNFRPWFISNALLNFFLPVFHDSVECFIIFSATKLQNIVCICRIPPSS